MNKDLDALLAAGPLSVPDDFAEKVMCEIQGLPMPPPKQTWRSRLQWLAIVGGMALGAVEVFSFIFGIWAVTTAY